MRSKGYFLVQCNSKVTNNRGKEKKLEKSAAMADRSSFASCCRVPDQINWVFDGLSLERLVDIQAMFPLSCARSLGISTSRAQHFLCAHKFEELSLLFRSDILPFVPAI